MLRWKKCAEFYALIVMMLWTNWRNKGQVPPTRGESMAVCRKFNIKPLSAIWRNHEDRCGAVESFHLVRLIKLQHCRFKGVCVWGAALFGWSMTLFFCQPSVAIFLFLPRHHLPPSCIAFSLVLHWVRFIRIKQDLVLVFQKAVNINLWHGLGANPK